MFYLKLNKYMCMSNFHALDVVGCGSETQLQVDENSNYLIQHMNRSDMIINVIVIQDPLLTT